VGEPQVDGVLISLKDASRKESAKSFLEVGLFAGQGQQPGFHVYYAVKIEAL
jgi:hypothetical protein